MYAVPASYSLVLIKMDATTVLPLRYYWIKVFELRHNWHKIMKYATIGSGFTLLSAQASYPLITLLLARMKLITLLLARMKLITLTH